jgi:eukaryotic-like serine/threonine-protein kinase
VVELPTTPLSRDLPTVPGYRLLDRIGEGGMGEVWRATQLCLERPVAVKLLHARAAGSTPSLDLQRESRVMALAAHRNVVAIHDCGQFDGRSYLILEYVAGPSLRALLAPGQPWELADALPVLDGIACGLAFIHQQGMLHLDLKPENVLLQTADGPGQVAVPKITDFGLARPDEDVRSLSELGLAQGSFDYCSPEQRFGLPLDARSDLFALATIAYEMLTGRQPGRVYVPVARRNPRLPRKLDAVLSQGLARNPEERFASVEAFRRALTDAARPRRGARTWLQWFRLP